MSKSNLLTVGGRGTITLPAKVRKSLGIKQGCPLIVEQTEEGILLRPAAVSVYPLEIYSPVRLKEFEEADKASPGELESLRKKIPK
jgi:AbrB family looped-hinge helix DNA binding protein